MFRILLLFITSLVLLSCTVKAPVFDLVIHNVNIINLEKGEILNEQSVFINADTIHSIVRTKDLLTSAAKTQIDGTGKYLMPGLWDNHVHFRGGDSLIEENKKFLNLYLANGITTVRDAGGDLTTSVMQWQEDMKNGVLNGPTIYTSGPKIDGPGATWAGSLEVSTSEDIERALDSLQSLEVDFVKIYDSKISAENYLQTIKKAEKRGMITSGHMPYSVTLEETTAAGIDAIEHLYYILKGCSLEEAAITEAVKTGKMGFWSSLDRVIKTYSETTAAKTFSSLTERDVYVVPTLHIGKTLSYLDEHDHTGDTYLNYIGPGIKKTYEGRINSALNASPEFVAMRKKLDSTFIFLTGQLHKNKVGILAGSDGGAYNSYIYPGISLHNELEALVGAGLSPLEALRTSSQNGAKFLKKTVPTMQSGAQADLIILNANPLQDVKSTQDIYEVIKAGRAFNRKKLDSLLEASIY